MRKFAIQISRPPSAGRRPLTITDVAFQTGLHPDFIRSLMDLDLIEGLPGEPEPAFEYRVIPRLNRIVRIKRDLGISLSSMALVLDLLDRIEELERQLREI